MRGRKKSQDPGEAQHPGGRGLHEHRVPPARPEGTHLVIEKGTGRAKAREAGPEQKPEA